MFCRLDSQILFMVKIFPIDSLRKFNENLYNSFVLGIQRNISWFFVLFEKSLENEEKKRYDFVQWKLCFIPAFHEGSY